MRRRLYRGPWLWTGVLTVTLLVVAVAATLGMFALTPGRAPVSPDVRVARPDVTVSADFSAPVGSSQFAPGITLVDNSLVYPSGKNSRAAVENAQSLLRQAVSFQNTPIMGWGLPDPWPDPSSPEPTNWTALDARLQLILNTGGIPVITLCEAPWWMKGQLQSDGKTIGLTKADEWSTRAYSSRILDDKMDAWLHLVQRIAERYMAPPYNVRYFQVWNELKGYYDPVTNNYDYTTSAGNPGGPYATHGYTYMYNRVYDQLMTVAGSLGIPRATVNVGGPYPVMDTWSTTSQSNPSDLTKGYGTFDQRPLDVVKYWLQHKTGAAFISVDADATNKNGVNIAYAFATAEKLADIVRWIRSLDNTIYPGARTLPIWLAEWYARPFTDWANNSHSSAIKTVAMMEFIKAGGAVALAWGSTDAGKAGPRLWTDTVKGGGAALPFYYSYRDFKKYFAPGTRLYQTTVSASGLVDAIASATTVMLVNKTPNALIVSVNGTVVSLDPYQVTTVRRTG